MRLKPVRGSIIGKTSDGYTATASNNQISPEVDQRVGEHIFVCVCVYVGKDRELWVNQTKQRGSGKGKYQIP